jgi:hypothetical protein
MPIVKWARIDATTERHLPTGVEVVKLAPGVGANITSRVQWMVARPARGGMLTIWHRPTRTDAKRMAETNVIAAQYQRRDEAHAEAIEVDGRMREAGAAEHFRQAVIATIPTGGLAADLLHAEALSENAMRLLAADWQDPSTDAALRDSIGHLRETAHAEAEDEDRMRDAAAMSAPSALHWGASQMVLSPVVAPQLHPEDTPKWDPQRRLATTTPASDAILGSAAEHALAGRPVPWELALMTLARLRRAELQLAAARAELIRRDAEQVLHLGRGGDRGLPRADGRHATSGLPHPTR